MASLTIVDLRKYSFYKISLCIIHMSTVATVNTVVKLISSESWLGSFGKGGLRIVLMSGGCARVARTSNSVDYR